MVAQSDNFDGFCNHMRKLARRYFGEARIDVEGACNLGLYQYWRVNPEQADLYNVNPPPPLLKTIAFARMIDQCRKDEPQHKRLKQKPNDSKSASCEREDAIPKNRIGVMFLPIDVIDTYAVSQDSDNQATDCRHDSINHEILEEITEKLDSRKDITRDIFRLKALGWSSAEISEVLNLSINAIDCRYSRVKREIEAMKQKFYNNN